MSNIKTEKSNTTDDTIGKVSISENPKEFQFFIIIVKSEKSKENIVQNSECKKF